MVEDPVPAETLVDIAEVGKSLDAAMAEAWSNASISSDGLQRLEELDQELHKALLRLAGEVDIDKVGMSEEQMVELGMVMQNLRGMHLPVEEIEGTGLVEPEVNDFEDSYAYQELESGIERQGSELDVESSFEVLIEAGVIVQCDGCGRQELANNSHRFSVVNGDVLCGPCRNADRDKQ